MTHKLINSACEVYDNSILLNGHLDDNTSGWNCNGGCSFVHPVDGYSVNGVQIEPRDQQYKGWSQSFDGNLLTAESYTGKCFIKVSHYLPLLMLDYPSGWMVGWTDGFFIIIFRPLMEMLVINNSK